MISPVDRMQLGRNHGVAHVTIEIVDEDGLPVTLADDNISVQIDGPARLLGLEGSNSTDMRTLPTVLTTACYWLISSLQASREP